jgi:Bifunctional DNA primase/polymerase, N-terminal
MPIQRPTNLKTTRAGTIARLKSLGLPALPVAPVQDAHAYPARNRQGEILREANGDIKPMFTGKNPSYLEGNTPSDVPRLLRHKVFQDRLPTQWEMQQWFAHPSNGVMTMGGWGQIIWIDIDVQHYSSQGRCDRSVRAWMERYPLLQETWIERTHSGGWRFGLQVEEMPDFTNFGFRRGKHIGEILGWGRLTVLAPTIGPSGNPYVCLQQRRPIQVQNVAAVGLKSSQAPRKVRKLQLLPTVIHAGALDLRALVSKTVGRILNGEAGHDDRSLLLTTVARELYGWEVWGGAWGLPIGGSADDLIAQLAADLDLDVDRIGRILKGVNRLDCVPAIVRAGGDIAAWRKVRGVNWDLYRVACSKELQQEIRGHRIEREHLTSR